MNLLIHGVRNYEITDGSVLNNPRFLDENNNVKQFDIIVSHPPFALKMWTENQISTLLIGGMIKQVFHPKIMEMVPLFCII